MNLYREVLDHKFLLRSIFGRSQNGKAVRLDDALEARATRGAPVPHDGNSNSKLFSDFLHSLHVVHAGNFPQPADDPLQVLQVFDVDDEIDRRLAVGGAGLDVVDVDVLVADERGHLLEHAAAIVAKHGELDRITGAAVFSVFAHSTSMRRSDSYIRLTTLGQLLACTATPLPRVT